MTYLLIGGGDDPSGPWPVALLLALLAALGLLP